MPWTAIWTQARGDAFRAIATYFLCWMTVRSLFGYGMVDGRDGMIATGWLLGGVLLACFAIVTWHVAQDLRSLDRLGLWTGYSAAFSAAVSIVIFYGMLPNHVFGERLTNWFVHGGLNSVTTGLTYGFALMWLWCIRDRVAAPRERLLLNISLIILLAAVCFTRCRGALLALLAAHVALTFVRGVRRSTLPWVALLGAITLFQITGPSVARLVNWQVATRAISPPVEASHTSAPIQEMLTRWDGGRTEIYARAMRGFIDPHEWLIGVGQWGPAEIFTRSLSYMHMHHHSIFIATLVHGGLIGLGLMLTLLFIGLKRAHSLARASEDTWFVLLVFGCTGLIFDGQTLTSLLSIPQMEPLLITFPLVTAASAWWKRRDALA
ncbi:O-antigen ligase family protein [Roseimicrobium gellanilyticum]|nr:O-antigen ligase family protein [Roseimicrobium gellanilyticum]